jgi:GNAT superfamily N-acetyltransferase
MLDIIRLGPDDRAPWETLARGYKTFYRTDLPAEAYEATWQRLMRGDSIYGFGAHLDGTLVGITHYLFQPHIWADDVCYLQDLFVDEAVRGKGVARALIERVAAAAKERGASTLYWLTHEENARARTLYDKVAIYKGFIRYDHVAT